MIYSASPTPDCEDVHQAVSYGDQSGLCDNEMFIDDELDSIENMIAVLEESITVIYNGSAINKSKPKKRHLTLLA